MKKKKLTVNALAGSNLKTRKKQYVIMIVGIILAMVFSSSVVLYLFSSNETFLEQAKVKYGTQDAIIYSYDNDESAYRKAKEDGAVTDYGTAHIIGYAYVSDDEENMGTSVGWLEDKAMEISNQSLLDGKYPTKENEIAVEKAALFKLGVDAKIGEKIALKVKTQNKDDFFDTKEKTYNLVGILSDKKSNIQNDLWNENNCMDVPAAFVAQETKTELGGKEKLVAYVKSDTANRDSEKSLWSYLDENGFRSVSTSVNRLSFSSISENSYLMAVIVLVLIFACCVAIINSFNTNLKERKRQIGMMRAVGATKRQIISIFGREALLISLICVPVSIAVSYGIVWSIIHLSSKNAVMTKSVAVLPVSAAVCLVVTMLASLLPLLSAAKITPIQAIRDIDNTRRMKTKKIKSKKNFNVSSHLAKRNLTFYKGGLIAVSVILSVTIVFSCLCFSLLSDKYGDIGTIGKDYEMSGLGAFSSDFINYGGGMSDADKQNIASLPYVSEAQGSKSVVALVETDEITKFHRAFLGWQIYESDLEGITYENFEEKEYAKYSEDYLNTKTQFGFKEEIIPVGLNGLETKELEILKDYLSDGKINIDKVASGEEIVLVAPKKAAKAAKLVKDGYMSATYFDDEKVNGDYQVVFEGENPYTVGDTLEITTIVCVDENNGEYKTLKKEAVIGAIISPSDLAAANDNEAVSINFGDFSFLTSTAGINNFCNNVKYDSISVFADGELDDETDKLLTDALKEISDKYGGFVMSDYAFQKNQHQDWIELLVSILSIIVVGFTICASIVNNTLTASIREKKKTIGTLRAVGASQRDVVISFIRQLLSMFKWGYGFGFSVFSVVYLILYAVYKYQKINGITFAESFYLSFSPWITIAFCVILFAICSINLWAKIRKEMKNSIIDNIREL